MEDLWSGNLVKTKALYRNVPVLLEPENDFSHEWKNPSALNNLKFFLKLHYH